MSSEVFENHESDIQELYESLNAKYRERLPKTSGGNFVTVNTV